MGKVKASMEHTENDVVFNPDENKLVVTGTLTAFRYGSNKYDKDNNKYYVSVKTSIPAAIRESIRLEYFEDSKEKYIPEPFRAPGESDDECYLNLKSLYEIPVFRFGEGNKRYSYDDVIELGDGLPPIGSEVKLSIRLKKGALYPLALLIIELVKQDASHYFE